MGLEIERKFLVKNDAWRGLVTPVVMCQAYISADPERIVRVRIEDEQARLTVKGKASGISRAEWEYSIPVEDARRMLESVCTPQQIIKHRYRIPYAGFTWEVDEFFGANQGLVVAEIELASEDQVFEKPDWIGEEVSHDFRYVNANLLKQPYSSW
ncbi:CYTH domain-containing protein [Undibacterium cyanobacteriorum]|uniref:CYTH domain-containing protein n=1 Tax=Undibacterium cyanobacteriorum TaxID=3073561 RepID=A0ABY9RCU7_9BURK|nr:CYTH domain-containing protein [Undibacterium sp. 20NA77.5]WMW78989.1 CYTH domain-containing protein [Undibacterium sp. 20NA77.5]